MSDEEKSPSYKVKPNKITFNSEELSGWSAAGGDGGSNEEEEEKEFMEGAPRATPDGLKLFPNEEVEPAQDGADALRAMREPFEKAARPSKAEVNSAYGQQASQFYTGQMSFQVPNTHEYIDPTELSWWQEKYNARCSTESVETDGGPDFGVDKIECPYCGDEFTEYDEEWVEEDGEKYCTITCLNLEING